MLQTFRKELGLQPAEYWFVDQADWKLQLQAVIDPQACKRAVYVNQDLDDIATWWCNSPLQDADLIICWYVHELFCSALTQTYIQTLVANGATVIYGCPNKVSTRTVELQLTHAHLLHSRCTAVSLVDLCCRKFKPWMPPQNSTIKMVDLEELPEHGQQAYAYRLAPWQAGSMPCDHAAPPRYFQNCWCIDRWNISWHRMRAESQTT